MCALKWILLVAILVWNKAFEPLGFEGAIEAKQQPDAAEWDAADVRYNVVRWMVQPGQGYAVGPSRTNPFTGEIFDADIRISADFVRYAHLEFTELVDPVGREPWASGDFTAPSVAAAMGHNRGFCDMADGQLHRPLSPQLAAGTATETNRSGAQARRGTTEDARTLARADLQTIAAQIEARLAGGGLDAYSRAHLDETRARIEAALEAGLERSL